MEISTKYDIGQELWFVTVEFAERKKCEHCGHIKNYVKGYKVNEDPLMIMSIEIDQYSITYHYDLGGHFTQESIETEKRYFTTRQAAQDECDRRNEKGGKE